MCQSLAPPLPFPADLEESSLLCAPPASLCSAAALALALSSVGNGSVSVCEAFFQPSAVSLTFQSVTELTESFREPWDSCLDEGD